MGDKEVMDGIRHTFGPFDYAGLSEVAEYLGISKQCGRQLAGEVRGLAGARRRAEDGADLQALRYP